MLSITLIKPRNKNWYAWLFFQAWQKGLQFTFLEKGKKKKRNLWEIERKQTSIPFI
jgi:hypothetical protein